MYKRLMEKVVNCKLTYFKSYLLVLIFVTVYNYSKCTYTSISNSSLIDYILVKNENLAYLCKLSFLQISLDLRYLRYNEVILW